MHHHICLAAGAAPDLIKQIESNFYAIYKAVATLSMDDDIAGIGSSMRRQ
jgi:hypothetical protein